MDNHFAFNEAVRQKLDHEHSVMNNRIGWHHAIQIAMFTGFYKVVSPEFPLHHLKYILPIMGVIYASSAIYSLWVSKKARACIFMHWNRYQTACNINWEDYPPVSGDPIPHILNSKKDRTIYKDMELKRGNYFFAKYFSKWFMLYEFIPILFILLWMVCFIDVVLQ